MTYIGPEATRRWDANGGIREDSLEEVLLKTAKPQVGAGKSMPGTACGPIWRKHRKQRERKGMRLEM